MIGSPGSKHERKKIRYRLAAGDSPAGRVPFSLLLPFSKQSLDFEQCGAKPRCRCLRLLAFHVVYAPFFPAFRGRFPVCAAIRKQRAVYFGEDQKARVAPLHNGFVSPFADFVVFLDREQCGLSWDLLGDVSRLFFRDGAFFHCPARRSSARALSRPLVVPSISFSDFAGDASADALFAFRTGASPNRLHGRIRPPGRRDISFPDSLAARPGRLAEPLSGLALMGLFLRIFWCSFSSAIYCPRTYALPKA